MVSARAQFGQYLPDWHPWEDYRKGYSAQRGLGGGVVLDRIHELDYLTWLMGDATAVTALVGHLSHLEIDTEDTAEILLQFANGAFGSVHLDYVRRSYDCALEVIGDQGTIQWCYQDHEVRWQTAGKASWETHRWPDYDGNAMYVEEMRHFLRALAGKEAPVLNLVAATRVIRLAQAAKLAGATRTWITL
jgi:predicted dehydrogenase